MFRLPPRSTRTATLLPSTTLFRSRGRRIAGGRNAQDNETALRPRHLAIADGEGIGFAAAGSERTRRGFAGEARNAAQIVLDRRYADRPVAGPLDPSALARGRSEEHTSELHSLMRISYSVFCLKKTSGHTFIHCLNST